MMATLFLINLPLIFFKVNAIVDHYCSSSMMCLRSSQSYVKYIIDKSPIVRRTEIKSLTFCLGLYLGIPHTSTERCVDPPEGIIYIMEGSASSKKRPGVLDWADCSIVKFREMRKKLACFKRTIEASRSSCGNGQVEDGEECDCVANECRICCNEDCKLTANSSCSNGPCCDISKCQFFDDKKQCRAAEDSCDIPELCDGETSKCPPNYVVANGYRCNGISGQEGYCFNGMCANRQDVCEWIFLDGSMADDECYDLNQEEGTEWGGCGPIFQIKSEGNVPSYRACSPEDIFCGRIYCTQPGIEGKTEMDLTEESKFLYSKLLKRFFKNSLLSL